ncbi:hypothetical protein [Mesorhizobium sp. M1142]|uniref:hypothetical protein n=1 Tax=Mesorhizobium sp. M1142 TaxID=2957060 RepID=UPI003336BBCC
MNTAASSIIRTRSADKAIFVKHENLLIGGMNGSTSRILRLALLAILQLAVLLFPLPVANALPQCLPAGLEQSAAADHVQDDETADGQQTSAHLGAYGADHSHDIPDAAIVAVSPAGPQQESWRQTERPAAVAARPSDIDRPPRGFAA